MNNNEASRSRFGILKIFLAKVSRIMFRIIKKFLTIIVAYISLPLRNPYSKQSASVSADVQCYCITDLAIECTVEDTERSGPTTMNLEIFSPERKTIETLTLEKISPLEWRHNDSIKLIQEATLRATWNETGSFGFIHLKTTELEELVTSTDSHNEVGREFMMETDDPVLKLRLRFGICCIRSDEKKVQQMQEALQFQTAIAEDPEKMFPMVLELSDNMPEKLQFLYVYVTFFMSRLALNVDSRRDLDNCILAFESAILLTPQNQVMPGQLTILGTLLARRFELTGDLTDIFKAISSLQKLVHLTPQGHVDMVSHLKLLGDSFQSRFGCTGDLTDISEAISSYQEAVNLTPPQGHAEFPDLLARLGNSFWDRFRRTGDQVDLSGAILFLQKAVHLTPQEHTNMSGWLTNLGGVLRLRFERTGDLADISEAITAYQKAVDLIPQGQADMPNHLISLGNSFQRRFDHTGDLADISEAISSHQKALHLTPQGHASIPLWLNELGTSFAQRFHCTRDLVDLSEAIAYQQKALHLIPEGHETMAALLNNLGSSFEVRFQHTRDVTEISEAISSYQKAVHLTPQEDPSMPGRLCNLGNSFQLRFQHTKELTDLSEAISLQQKALHLVPQGHADIPRLLGNLANSFHRRFECRGDPFDLSESISYRQKAIHLTPQGHDQMSIHLTNLGHSFRRRFECTENFTDIQTALSNYSLAAIDSSGQPSIRLRAAILWARWSQKFAPLQSLDAYNIAIQLVSQVAGLEQTVQKRHTTLIDISNLAASAAACALKLKRPDFALEWLEQGRCLVWSQLNNLRTPLDALFAHNPAIADEMLRVSRALENAGSREDSAIFKVDTTMEQKMSLQDKATAHVKLAQEWTQLLENIRSIPEFEDFLRPPLCSNLLKSLPDSGPVVVINIHEDSCDALALVSGRDEPLHIPLPKFSYTKANNLRKQLNTRLHSANLRMRGCELDEASCDMIRKGRPVEGGAVIKLEDILHQLWSLVVEPILDGLAMRSAVEPLSDLPRIWWCATGPIAFLPIHAAGIYATSTRKAGPTLSDFAISSYLPTVRALAERLKGPRTFDQKKTGLFMISQPETPNLPRIPGTTKEVRAIKEVLQDHNVQVLCLESEAATVNQGIANMETHSCIHFACHASQNTHEPLKSKFILHDGDLELSAIIKKNLVGADLAYLSACQTSTGDEKLSEEAVHLAAGMLAAGYRGVVATMWSISDKHGPQIAEDFYGSLITHGAKSERLSALSSDAAARALHHATQNLRKKLGDEASSLLVWVPYVHFGL